MKVGKISDKKKVLQFMVGAPWRCIIHWRNKLMRRFYWLERLIWKELYWTLCTVRSTNTYDKGVLLWLMSSVLARCEVLWLSANLYSASKNKGIQIRWDRIVPWWNASVPHNETSNFRLLFITSGISPFSLLRLSDKNRDSFDVIFVRKYFSFVWSCFKEWTAALMTCITAYTVAVLPFLTCSRNHPPGN